MAKNTTNSKFHRVPCFLLALILTGLAVLPGLADANMSGLADTPWPMFLHDQRHSGLSTYTGAQQNTVKWTYDASGSLIGSPVIGSDGTVYISSRSPSPKLHAINPDGSPKWSTDMADGSNGAPAIGRDGTIYVISESRALYAFNPDGNTKWLSPLMCSGITGSPVIADDGTIYCGQNGSGGAGCLYAFTDNGGSGSLKWSKPYQTGTITSSPAIGNAGTIYIGDGYHYLYAITDNVTEGAEKWSFFTGGAVNSSPCIGIDGTIYVGVDDGYLYAIIDSGINSVSQKWKFNTYQRIRSSPAIGSDGTIYIGSYDNKMLWAIKPADGSLKWSYPVSGNILSSPAIGNDGTLYFGTVDNMVYAISDNTTNGVLKWLYPTGGEVSSSPAIGSDGSVYIGSWDDKLYAFGPLFPTVTSVNPDHGTQGQTLTVILTGSNYTDNTTVRFGPEDITVNSCITDNSTKITSNITVADNATPGNRYIQVNNDGYGVILLNAFTVLQAAPSIVSVNPNQGTQGQAFTITITGTHLTGSTAVNFSGMGVTAGPPTVISDTQITVSINISADAAPGARDVSITTPGGTGTKISGFTVAALPPLPPPPQQPQFTAIGTSSKPGGSSGSMSSSISTTQPVVNATIIIQSASLSRLQTSGEPVTVSATVANTSTVNGTTKVRVYVNGRLDSEQAVTVASGRQIPVSFTVSRNEPGSYQVYVNGTPAGSFTVSDNSTILYISIACLFLAFLLGVILIIRKPVKQ